MKRISQKVLDECNTLEDLLDKATTLTTGERMTFSEIGSDDNNYSSFKSRLKMFKEVIERDLPNFTWEEILKFDEFYHDLKKVYDWHGVDYLLKAVEFEIEKSKL